MLLWPLCICRADAARVHLAAPRRAPGADTEHLHQREPRGALAALPQPGRERERRRAQRRRREAVAQRRGSLRALRTCMYSLSLTLAHAVRFVYASLERSVYEKNVMFVGEGLVAVAPRLGADTHLHLRPCRHACCPERSHRAPGTATGMSTNTNSC